MKTMTIGTDHFETFNAACRYYRPYDPEMTREEIEFWVKDKLYAGEIHIGAPDPTKYPGFVSMKVNSEGRYEVTCDG